MLTARLVFWSRSRANTQSFEAKADTLPSFVFDKLGRLSLLSSDKRREKRWVRFITRWVRNLSGIRVEGLRGLQTVNGSETAGHVPYFWITSLPPGRSDNRGVAKKLWARYQISQSGELHLYAAGKSARRFTQFGNWRRGAFQEGERGGEGGGQP